MTVTTKNKDYFFGRSVGWIFIFIVGLVAIGGSGVTPTLAEEIALPGASYNVSSSSVVPGTVWGREGEEEVYRIGASDVLDISVWQSPDLNKTVTVRFDGRIAFPLAGEIMAAGLTPAELSAEISERLREFIRNPQITVSVKEFHSRQVVVLGKVGKPGIYPIQGPMKLLELLTAAGLNLADIDMKNVTVMRSSGDVLKIDLEALLYRSDIRQNIDLRSGDNIFIPEKPSVSTSGPQMKEIMVLGEIAKPGAYTFPSDKPVTVKEILLSGGGVTERASLSTTKIVRANKFQEPTDLNKLIFNGDMSQDLPLYAGDVLYIPKTKLMRVYVLGMVQRKGIIEGQPNTLDLLQAISLSTPEKFGAVLSNVKVVRGWPNNPKVMNANVEALLYRGRLEENIPLQDGDVIYVPESFLSNATDFITKLLAPLSGTVSFVNSAQDVRDNTR